MTDWVLFGGPLDGKTIGYKNGWKVRVLSSVDFLSHPWRCFFDDYVRLAPNLKVLAWMGPADD